MRPLRCFLSLSLYFYLAGCFAHAADQAPSQELVRLENAQWSLTIDPSSGALVGLRHRAGEANWLREAGHWEKRQWVANAESVRGFGGWGLVESVQTGLLHLARLQNRTASACDSLYEAPSITVTVHRELEADGSFSERITFINTGQIAFVFPLGSLGIQAPLFDQYPDAERSEAARSHVHLWMGGASSWIEAQRMSGQGERLGLVLTQGSLEAYSQRGGNIGDRGLFVLHPSAFTLQPGKPVSLSWRWFWNHDWEDFFAQAAQHSANYVRLSASTYVPTVGETLRLELGTSSGQLFVDGHPLALEATAAGRSTAALSLETPGEHLVELRRGEQRSWLRLWAAPAFQTLLEARLRFLISHQQVSAPTEALDGALVAFDNETDHQVCEDKPADHNAGRERVGMGVLLAMAYRHCEEPSLREALRGAVLRYASYVERELEDETGLVYGTPGRRNHERLYNFPWSAQLHLELYRSFGDTRELDRMLRVLRRYYAEGGERFYGIGLPVRQSLAALAKAGRMAEYAELAALYRQHAERILANGPKYPAAEVNFEQSIVAPGAEILLETGLALQEPRFLAGAREQLRLLEAFAGMQPDHRLYEIPIRHWDDYWFGKLRLYGDTFPHYWSSLNGLAYAQAAEAYGDTVWLERAVTVLRGNLSLFSPDGRASCAHVYPLTLNGQPASRNDPWANDQDWALVHSLMVQELRGSP